MRHLTLLILLLAVSTSLFSQTISSTATESRCLNSGTITISINGGTPTYSYSITGASTATTSNSAPITTFTSLISGVYYIQVIDQNNSYLDTITVPGSYVEPRFNLDVQNIVCGGANNGKLWATNISQGRPDYQFQIIAPASQATPLQSSDTFFNLPPDTYTVRMYDSCGNFQTRTATLLDNYKNLGVWQGQVDGRLSCDSAILYIRPFNGLAPYTIRVQDPTNSNSFIDSLLVPAAGYYPFSLPIYYPSTSTSSPTSYRFEVTDACGNLKSINNQFNIQNTASTTVNCTGFTFEYGTTRTTNSLFGDSVWLSISPDPQGISPMPFRITNGTTLSLDSIPYGTYNYTITTQCDTITGSFTEDRTQFDSISTTIIPEACNENLAQLRIEPYNRPDGLYTTQIWKDATLIRTLTHGSSGTTETNIESNNNTYTLVMWNECMDTVKRTINVDTSTRVKLYGSTSPFCSGGGNIHVGSEIENSDTRGKFYRLYDLGGSQIRRTLTSNDTATWTNIPAGTYVTSVFYGNYGNLNSSYCQETRDTIELSAYSFPTVEALQIACTGGDFAVQGQNVTGLGPFTYYLTDQSTMTTIRGPQAVDTFTRLAGIGPYTLLAVDSCGNTASANANAYIPDVNISIVNGEDCENQIFQAAIDTTLETVYSWTGPSSFVSSSNSIKFKPLLDSDAGSYFLDANMLNGCLYINDTIIISANKVTQALVSTPSTTCFGMAPLYDSVVSIVNATSPVGTENGYWYVMSNPTNAAWKIYDSASNSLRFLTDSAGDYSIVWSIKSDLGCISRDTAVITSTCPSLALPIELISIAGKRTAAGVNLQWVVASQLSNYGFNLMRSTDGVEYKWLGFVPGDGTYSPKKIFSFTDQSAPDGKLFYKLVQQDFDGRTKEYYTSVSSTEMGHKILIYPNPSSGTFTIELPNGDYENLTIATIDGSDVFSKSIINETKLTISSASFDLGTGVFFVKVSNRNTSNYYKVLITK